MDRCGAVLTVDVVADTFATSPAPRWPPFITGVCLRPAPCPEHAGVLVVPVRPAPPATACPCGGL